MRKTFAIALVVVLALALNGWAVTITIDGDMLDWAEVDAADVGLTAEETGDMPTGPEFDIVDFYITSDGDNVYCRIDIDPSGTFTGGFLNYTNVAIYELWFGTNAADTIGLGWEGFWTFAPDYRIDLGDALNPDVAAGEVTVYHYGSDWAGSEEIYDSVGVAQIAVNDDDNALEIAVPRAAIARDLFGKVLQPMCYFVGDEIWDNEEYVPNDAAEGNDPGYTIWYSLVEDEAINLQQVGDWRVDAITVDGDMVDWESIPLAAVDETAEAAGDMPTGAEFDVVEYKLASDAENFYGYIAIDPSATFTDAYLNYTNPPILELFLDTSLDDTSGLGWGWWPITANYVIELQEAYNPDEPTTEVTVMAYSGPYSGAGEWTEIWTQVGTATVMINGDDNALEFSVPWDILNNGPYFNTFIYSVGDFIWDYSDMVPNDWNNTTGPTYAINYSVFDGPWNLPWVAGEVSVGEEPATPALPDAYRIVSTYPNPFNSTTRVTYTVPNTGVVDVAVYDIMGRLVKTLLSGNVTAGTHRTVWNGTNGAGSPVSTGMYFVRVSGETGNAVARTLLVK